MAPYFKLIDIYMQFKLLQMIIWYRCLGWYLLTYKIKKKPNTKYSFI